MPTHLRANQLDKHAACPARSFWLAAVLTIIGCVAFFGSSKLGAGWSEAWQGVAGCAMIGGWCTMFKMIVTGRMW